MRVAFYESAQDNVPRVEDVTWPQLRALFTTHRRSQCPQSPCPSRCPAKNGPAWSPVDISERRRNENVRAVTLAVFDLDHLTAEQLAPLDELERGGYAFALHSTHSHRPPDYCLRLIMPLSRPVLPREWPAVRTAALALLRVPADPATKDLSRLYYLPDAPEGAEPFAESTDGRPLDVDELLASARAGLPVTASPSAPSAPMDAASTTTDQHHLGSLLRRHARPENKALIGRVLRGQPLAPRGSQDTTLQQLMSTVAFCLPTDTPDAAIVELLRPCYAATDWEQGTEHLISEALKKLHRARVRKTERDAKRLVEHQALWERLGISTRAITSTSELTPTDEGQADPDEWMKQLVTYETREETRLRNLEANIYTVLLHAPEWRGALRFNEVTKELELSGSPLRADVRPDELDSEIAVWFQNSEYGRLGLNPKPSHVREVLRIVARQNAYDPLRDYLEGLVWDGKPRIDTFLERYLGATGDTEHLRTIGPKWLISAVARALRPGCKVDTVLILEGPQGLQKSTAFRILAGEWFSDAPLDIGNKDSAALASQFWVQEMAELETVRRAADVQALKAYVSRNEDIYRPPYGRVTVRTPRRCVLVGTTNSEEYLRNDPSGYRRWWPVRCTSIDIAALKQDRAQLWAEAVVRFHQGEQWWLTEDQAERAEAQAKERSETPNDGKRDAIVQWLTRMSPARRPAEVPLLQVAEEALGVPKGQLNAATDREIASVLRDLGFRNRIQCVSGVRRRVWVVPEALRNAPEEKPATAGHRPH
ncbi:virulence-associated protein E domain-containing protein [Myxococcus stipitatus DSM 14675]|uniref:Virulence-associated protein E domain-containing protein n=1 Tax=Myxococcus stipitatus (strain DSM 14675 / JCM 12634 / Mx s8) TaxID=1278073 RepID=L7U9N8_MYXSD|nr:VapE domain-containing protein [Myxococcus stipitatus]AGC44565.1 virulence-associated protein E domain-containing protein [Myxococcus stipitatus DSM 14675]